MLLNSPCALPKYMLLVIFFFIVGSLRHGCVTFTATKLLSVYEDPADRNFMVCRAYLSEF